MSSVQEEIAVRRLAWLVSQPSTLGRGERSVLEYMAGDLKAREWAGRFECAPLEVERACAHMNVKCKPEGA
jgi:hypothetical protein